MTLQEVRNKTWTRLEEDWNLKKYWTCLLDQELPLPLLEDKVHLASPDFPDRFSSKPSVLNVSSKTQGVS